MNYRILGDSDTPMIDISLGRGEVIKAERGAMVFMQNVDLKGETNSRKSGLGGLVGALARSAVSGESMFITKATGLTDGARLGIAPAVPGKIDCLEVGGSRQYRLNTGAFLACDNSVSYNIRSQDLGKAFFGGTGGLFVMETEGTGQVLINAFGDMIVLDVNPSSPLVIDNEHVVAWDINLDYNIRIASGTFGFMSGEGVVNEFYGTGKVIIQTRNIRSLSEEVAKFIPTSNGR
ncbi:MAG: TIGR00266 family protein [Firmicutes bacterium]|nr:TIGR00266 family protein [Bacillota bacterium]